MLYHIIRFFILFFTTSAGVSRAGFPYSPADTGGYDDTDSRKDSDIHRNAYADLFDINSPATLS